MSKKNNLQRTRAPGVLVPALINQGCTIRTSHYINIYKNKTTHKTNNKPNQEV
jgi:hypothetical protein